MVKIHTTKDATWTNAAGEAVPYKFVPKTDKLKESLAGKLVKMALSAEDCLKALHIEMNKAMESVSEVIKNEYLNKYSKEKKAGKGSFTWFNWDRSVKIEADINEIEKWDGALMTEALSLFKKYINDSLSDSNELINSLVNDAFSNSKGQIDSKKINQLLKYQDKIKNKSFLKACELIVKARDIDKKKLYQRVWIKTDDGSYRNVQLNFSAL